MSDVVHHYVGCVAGRSDYKNVLKIYNMPFGLCFSISVFVVTLLNTKTVCNFVYQGSLFNLSFMKYFVCWMSQWDKVFKSEISF